MFSSCMSMKIRLIVNHFWNIWCKEKFFLIVAHCYRYVISHWQNLFIHWKHESLEPKNVIYAFCPNYSQTCAWMPFIGDTKHNLNTQVVFILSLLGSFYYNNKWKIVWKWPLFTGSFLFGGGLLHWFDCIFQYIARF
jgi:hypothetical protein